MIEKKTEYYTEHSYAEISVLVGSSEVYPSREGFPLTLPRQQTLMSFIIQAIYKEPTGGSSSTVAGVPNVWELFVCSFFLKSTWMSR